VRRAHGIAFAPFSPGQLVFGIPTGGVVMSALRFLAALAPALLVGVCGCGHSTPPQPVLFGHVAGVRDTSGSAQRGIRMAVEQANKDPEHAAGRPVKVLHADPHGKLETLEAEAVRLVTVNRVHGLLGGVTAEELERFDRARSVVVSPCGLRPAALSENVFCTGLSPTFQGQVLARFAREELKLEKIAIVVDERRAEYRQVADAFARAWAAAQGAAPVATLGYGKDAKFAELAKRVQEETPAAVLFAGPPDDLRAWRQAQPPPKESQPQAQARGEPVPVLFAGDDGSLPALLRERDTRTSLHLVTAFVKDGGPPRMQQFASQYAELFQEEPDAAAALAYDNARLLFEAYRRSSDSGKSVAEELAAVKDFAGLGGTLTFDAERCARRPAFVVKLDDGKASMVKQYPTAN
jgi:branched-chain amino acid transport system substrate-binding protein